MEETKFETTSPLVIEWVHDDYSGPVNGICKHGDDFLWFCRANLPTSLFAEKGREYLLIRPCAELLDFLQSQHKKYSELSGYPLKHGDPYNISNKSESINFNHGYNPNSIPGEKLGIVSETEFCNYFMPRMAI